MESLEGAVLAAVRETELVAVGVLRGDDIVWANPGLRAALGWSSGTATQALRALLAPSDAPRVERALAAADDTRRTIECRIRRPSGSEFDAELSFQRATGMGDAVLVVCTDVTERRRAETQLSYLAFVDPLTGLPNRALFLDRLREALILARRNARPMAVLMGDLDGFKAVNDTHGHDVGDAVLREVARRLKTTVRDTDTVARLGGDEFAFLLTNTGAAQVAALVAGRAIRALREPIVVGDRVCAVGISVGIALYPSHGNDLDTLLAAADSGMYAAKRDGRNRFAMPDTSLAVVPVYEQFVHWDSTRDLGVAQIDAQHRGLAELINCLGDDLKLGRDRDRLIESISALVDFTRMHFATEEALMKKHGVAGADLHEQAHGQLLEDLRCLSVGLDEKSMMLTMRYLIEWLIRHVDSYDRALARTLNELGVR